MFTRAVADGEKAGHVVSYAIVKDETTNTLLYVVSQFRKLNPAVHVKTFIVNNEQ